MKGGTWDASETPEFEYFLSGNAGLFCRQRKMAGLVVKGKRVLAASASTVKIADRAYSLLSPMAVVGKTIDPCISAVLDGTRQFIIYCTRIRYLFWPAKNK